MIVAGVVAIVAFFGGWLALRKQIGKLGEWLSHKTKIEQLAYVDELLVGMGLHLWGESEDWLKEASADGVITKAELREWAHRLWGVAKEEFDLQKLSATLGGASAEKYLGIRAPAAIAEAKSRAAGNAPKPLDPSQG